jgi:hypothetical protein
VSGSNVAFVSMCRCTLLRTGEKWRPLVNMLINPPVTWSWALLEEPPNLQLFKNFPAFYGTRRLITMFIRALHWPLSWARSIQSLPSQPSLSKIHFNIVHPHTPRTSQWFLSFWLHLNYLSFWHYSYQAPQALICSHRNWFIQTFVC